MPIAMSLGMGAFLGAATPVSGGGVIPSYDPDAQLFFDRADVVPDLARRQLISEQYVRWKNIWLWSDSDGIYIHANYGAQPGRLDWRDRFGDGRYNCLGVNNPVFTADAGYMGDGSSSYLDSQFNPATAVSPKFTQNSGSLGVRSNTNNTSTGSLAGFFSGSNTGTTINPRVDNTNGVASFRANTGITGTNSANGLPINANSVGLYVANRVGATDIRGYKNGVLIASGAQASVAVASGNLRLGSISNTSYRACQFASAFIARGATDAEIAQVYDAFEPWRAAVGLAA